MIERRNSADRGHADHGWLKAKHSFSFAGYYDPAHTGFGALRVINDDFIAGGGGFSPHPHRDMEIITYVTSGALAHKDSMGNGSVIEAGDVQHMSAGTGVTHSECNASKELPVTLLQIWITPRQQGLSPRYEQKHFSAEEKRNQMKLIASPDGENDSISISQDVRLYAGLFDHNEVTIVALDPARRYYLHVVRGAVSANGEVLSDGDAIKVTNESSLRLGQAKRAEVLLFDLA